MKIEHIAFNVADPVAVASWVEEIKIPDGGTSSCCATRGDSRCNSAKE